MPDQRDPLEAKILAALKGSDPDRLRQLVRGHREITEIKRNLGPQTKEELWQFFKAKYDVELVNVAVCPGHVSQLDFVWWVYNFGNCLAVFSRGYGKCVAAGTMIYDASSGRRVPVEDVCDGRPLRVAAMTESGVIEAADAYGESQGLKSCLNLTTKTGRSIRLSYDHPLLTSSGWTHAEHLDIGDHVALPRILPEPDWVIPLGDEELDMLAVLLSEGCYTQQSIMFSTSDPRIVDIMQRAVEPYSCRVVHSANYDYRIVYSKRVKNPIRQVLDSVGIGNEGARTKRLPNIMWSLSNDQISRFLGIFWMCDGYVQVGGPHVALASEGLVRDIAKLLLRLGIQSIVKQKRVTTGGKSFQSWILSVRGTCFKRFFERVPLWGEKYERMSVIAGRDGNANLGRPSVSDELMSDLDSAIKRLSRQERADRGREIANMLDRKHHGMFSTSKLLAQKGSSKTFSASRFRAAIDTLPNEDWSEYEYLGSDDLWWDEIVSIEDAGDQQTYDICVPDYGNFVADDIIVHNTSLMAWTDDCQAVHYPGWGSFTIGPGKDQGERKYEHLLPFVVEGGVIGGKELPHVQRSIMTKTQYSVGSTIEIALGGGIDNANGPRQPRLHRDEIELMLDATRKQAVNIPAGKKTRDGRYVPAQTVDTSTMKWAGGYVDTEMEAYYETLKKAEVDPTEMEPIEAFQLSIERGHRPRKLMLVSCIYEIAAENPACSSVPEMERRARLVELGRDPNEVCDCSTYVSDVWDTDDPEQPPQPRTLEDVCQGRFFRSRGYQRFDDIQTFFLDNDRITWEAEKECSQPSREGAYLKSYSQDRHGIRGYEPDPENGPIYTATDWGATDEACTLWIQILERPVAVRSFKGSKIKTMPVGSRVVVSEFFKAQIGNTEHGNVVVARELEWFLRWPGWKVDERHADNADRGAILDWRDQCGLIVINRIKKDFNEEVKLVRTMVGGWTFYIDIPACPNTDKALRGWKQVNGREVHNQHCLVAGTIVDTEVGPQPIEDVEVNERVWTRAGLRKVLWSGQTGTSETLVVEHECGRVECTAGHRFWTQRGWVEASLLEPNSDRLLECKFSERSEYESMLSTVGSGTTATQRAITTAPETTSRPTIRIKDTSPCIDKFGSISGERSRMDTKFTMKMEIQTTTWSTTLLQCLSRVIERLIATSLGLKNKSITSIASDLWHIKLWLDRMFGRSVGRTATINGTSVKATSRRWFVVGAQRSTKQMPSTLGNSAPTTVGREIATIGELTTKSVSVKDAEQLGPSTDTPKLNTAETRVLRVRIMKNAKPVFDLCVEEHHEFIADGVLVHNSHPMACLRYFAHERHVVARALSRAGSRDEARPAAAEDEEVRATERAVELERGIRVVRHGSTRARETVGTVAGAEDSPIRSGSTRIGGPDLRRIGEDR